MVSHRVENLVHETVPEKKLGDLILPSANFDVELKRNGQGNLTRVIFKGKGYGHGVGMCQCGAIGRARQGLRFDAILTHFYTGVEIKKLY